MIKIKFVCPECKKNINGWLSHYSWGTEQPKGEQSILLHIKGCESGGIYDVSMECPKCEAELDLWD